MPTALVGKLGFCVKLDQREGCFCFAFLLQLLLRDSLAPWQQPGACRCLSNSTANLSGMDFFLAGFIGGFFMAVVASVSVWVSPNLRVLALKKQFSWVESLGKHSKRPFLRLMPPSRGGGPGGNKLPHRLQVQNTVASVLLEEGYELSWASDSVAKMLSKMGTKELAKVFSSNHDSRFPLVRKALSNCAIDFPTIKPGTITQAAFQAKINMNQGSQFASSIQLQGS